MKEREEENEERAEQDADPESNTQDHAENAKRMAVLEMAMEWWWWRCASREKGEKKRQPISF
jgi:hypothetical protein